VPSCLIYLRLLPQKTLQAGSEGKAHGQMLSLSGHGSVDKWALKADQEMAVLTNVNQAMEVFLLSMRRQHGLR